MPTRRAFAIATAFAGTLIGRLSLAAQGTGNVGWRKHGSQPGNALLARYTHCTNF